MPAIRTLVKGFDMPAAAPNVYTGIESVLPLLTRMTAANPETPSKRSSRTVNTSTTQQTTVTNTQILAVIATLFLYIHTKMKDVDVTPEQYKEWRETTVGALIELPQAKETSCEELSTEIEEMLPLAQNEGWLRMEWFLNVQPSAWAEGNDDVQRTGGIGGRAAKKRNAGGLGLRSRGSDYIGLGTMMQDAVDFLGERRKEEYVIWKEGIMSRIEEVEAR